MPNNKPGTDMVPYKKKRGAGILPILLVLLLIGGLTGLTWFLTRADGDASPKQTVIVVTPGGCDKVKVATDAMLAQGFSQSDFVIGAGQIDWKQPEANERGSAAFATATPTSANALVEELSSDTTQANAALGTLMDESGAKRDQLLKAKNWIPVQFKVQSAWDGNTAYRNGDVVSAGTRNSAAGDVVWLFVNPKKCKPNTPVIDVVTAHRAGCGNPQTALPRPVTPVNPTPPPTGEQGKDHRLAPPTTVVVYCPPGQYLDRYTETCISPPATTTTTNGGQGDSGDGATNTTTPPSTTAPPPAPPTTSPPTTPPPPPTIPSL